MIRIFIAEAPGLVSTSKPPVTASSSVMTSARAMLQLDDAAIEQGRSLGQLLDGQPIGPESLVHAEREVVAGALAQTQGNVSQAASLLGISRATLHRRLRALGLHRDGAFR